MVDHFQEFVDHIDKNSNYKSRIVDFSKTFALSVPSELDGRDVAHFLQLYGDYVIDMVNIALAKWSYPLNASLRSFPVLGSNKKRHLLYFTVVITINDDAYEVVLEKSIFRSSSLPRSKGSFNRKTRQLIAAIVSRLNVLGSDEDRRIAIPLPVASSEALLV